MLAFQCPGEPLKAFGAHMTIMKTLVVARNGKTVTDTFRD
jgi:hypothetical protein